MPFTVTCQYGSGTRKLTAVVDSLIFTQAEATARGYADLNRVWKIIETYTVKMPAFEGSHVIEVGKYITLLCPEIGLVNQTLYVASADQDGSETGVTMISAVFERYQDFEAARA